VRGRHATHGELAGVVEDAGAAGGEVDAVQRGTAPSGRIGEGRDEAGEAEELAERVDDVATVGEAAGGAQREVHAVGEVVGAHAGAVEEVVVAVVHQRAPEHEHALDLLLLLPAGLVSTPPPPPRGGYAGAAMVEARSSSSFAVPVEWQQQQQGDGHHGQEVLDALRHGSMDQLLLLSTVHNFMSIGELFLSLLLEPSHSCSTTYRRAQVA
jgi:hypothetical protein